MVFSPTWGDHGVRCSTAQALLQPRGILWKEWDLNDEEIAALDLQGAASLMEVEGELPNMNAEEMAKEGFYLVNLVIRYRYRQGWLFLTLWEGF